MLDNSFLKKFNELSTHLNNTNTFLLDISLPLINYLIHKNNDFEEIFGQACRNNRRFASKTLDSVLFEKTDDFLISMSYSSEYIGCKCHDKTWAEFHQEIAPLLHEYCLALLQVFDKNKFNETLITISSAFGDDYNDIKSSFIENRIELAQAEKVVLYWQGAVPDIVMQEAILQLRYDYIRKFINSTQSP